jgi:hypothetical protein
LASFADGGESAAGISSMIHHPVEPKCLLKSLKVESRPPHIVTGAELDFLIQYSVFLGRRGLAPVWKTQSFSVSNVPKKSEY